MSGVLQLLMGDNAPPAASTTTLDPSSSKTNANIVLSNGNLTALASVGGNRNYAQSLGSDTSGKKYYEAHFTVITNGQFAAGIIMANSSFAITSAASNTTDSLEWFISAGGTGHDGEVRIHSVTAGTIATTSSPVFVCVAIDLDAKLFWGRFGSGNWNNSGTANPATGTEGIDISGMTFGTMFAGIDCPSITDACTVNFGATAYNQTPPSGFGNW